MPYTSARTRIGTPRKDRIGGCPAGKPCELGLAAMSGSRSGRGSLISAPSRPRPSGQWWIAGDLLVGQADRHELGQPAAVADHPERAVAGPDQGDGGLHDLLEHHLQVEVGAHRDDRFEQRVDPVPGGQHGLQPGLQLGQQVVEPQLRQHRMLIRRLHGLPQASKLLVSLNQR